MTLLGLGLGQLGLGGSFIYLSCRVALSAIVFQRPELPHLVELVPFLQALVYHYPGAVAVGAGLALAVLVAAAGTVDQALGAHRHRADAGLVGQQAVAAGAALLQPGAFVRRDADKASV